MTALFRIARERALILKGKAVGLTDPNEILRVRRIKKGVVYNGSPNDFLGDAIRRVYRAVPQKVWTNDAEVKDSVFVRDYRIEISLETLKELLRRGFG